MRNNRTIWFPDVPPHQSKPLRCCAQWFIISDLCCALETELFVMHRSVRTQGFENQQSFSLKLLIRHSVLFSSCQTSESATSTYTGRTFINDLFIASCTLAWWTQNVTTANKRVVWNELSRQTKQIIPSIIAARNIIHDAIVVFLNNGQGKRCLKSQTYNQPEP